MDLENVVKLFLRTGYSKFAGYLTRFTALRPDTRKTVTIPAVHVGRGHPANVS